jgi:hypothetical protein
MTMWEKDRPFVILLSFVFGLFPLSAFAEAEQTPEAGKEFHTTLFGEKIYVPSRDRRSVTAANFGLHWIPNGPSEREILPFGALYVWRNWDKDNRRFRGVFSGAVNRIDYTIGLRTFPNWSLIFTLDNFIVPLGQSEYVEGQRISESELNGIMCLGGSEWGIASPLSPLSKTAPSMCLSPMNRDIDGFAAQKTPPRAMACLTIRTKAEFTAGFVGMAWFAT